MQSMIIIRLCNASGRCTLSSVEANHTEWKGAIIMKKCNVLRNILRDGYAMRYMDGVPAAAKKQYWRQSPWNAFRLLRSR